MEKALVKLNNLIISKKAKDDISSIGEDLCIIYWLIFKIGRKMALEKDKFHSIIVLMLWRYLWELINVLCSIYGSL